MPRVNMNDFKQETIHYPQFEEQQRIADRLDALSANVKALQTNYTETITLCNDLKQALLKKVFG
jgi:restriction endonuclease S subunit